LPAAGPDIYVAGMAFFLTARRVRLAAGVGLASAR
jgi:hypothetical protein